jgi:hypothetical protein
MKLKAVETPTRKPVRNGTRAEIARLRRQVKYLQRQREMLLAALRAATQGHQAG